MPSAARPAANVTACCSAMPTSKVRSGNSRAEDVETGAVGHGSSDRYDALYPSWLPRQGRLQDARVGRRVLLGLHLRAGDDVELGNAVVLVVRGFGGGVTLALLRHDVDEDRALLRIAHVLQDGRSWFISWPSRGLRSRSRAPRTTCRPAKGGGCILPCGAARRSQLLGRRLASCFAKSRR